MSTTSIQEYTNIPFESSDGHTSPSPKQMLDLYIPAPRADADAPVRLIFFVHGGAWVSGDKQQHVHQARLWVQTFASAPRNDTGGSTHLDTVVAVPNYRLSPSVQHPSHASDIYDALQFLLAPSPSQSENATIPILKYEEIWLVGHSAGAHILPTTILSSSFQPPSNASAILSRVKGIICLAGIYDIDLLLANQPWTRGFVDYTFGKKGSYKESDSTSYAIPKHAEHLNWAIVFSRDDELADTAQSDKMYKSLLERYGFDEETAKGRIIKDYKSVRGRHDPLLDTEGLAQFVKKRILGA